MTLRKVDLNLLTVFDAIYSEGNLTRAATHIGMSQPAMSNALSRLRHLTKDELFVRESRGIRPTAGASKLAPLVRQALNLIEEGLALTEGFDPLKTTCFHIGGIDYYEVAVLPQLVQEFQRRAPNQDMHATTGTSREFAKPLRYGEMDLLIDYVPLTGRDYHNQVLFEEELVVLHRRGHALIGDTLNLDKFVSCRHVFRALRDDEPAPAVDQKLARMGLERNIALTISNWLALPATISNSDLICTAPRRIAELYAANFDLVVSPLPLNVPSVPVFMIWHEGKHNSPSNRWLRAQLKRACRKL